MKQKIHEPEPPGRSRVKEFREARGIPVTALAERCGVRRQTIYAIEEGAYVPNASIAIRLARELGSSVEELFPLADDDTSSSTQTAALLNGSEGFGRETQLVQVCQRAGRLIVIPVQPASNFLPRVDAAIERRAGRRAEVRMIGPEVNRGECLVIAGCDPGLSILQKYAEAAGLRVAILACSSRTALRLLKSREVDVAGSHLLDRASGEYNSPIVRCMFGPNSVSIFRFASWEEGLIFRGKGRRVRTLADLGTGDFQIVNREKGSGSRSLLDEALADAGISSTRVPGYDRITSGHIAAAFAVASGAADCCIGTKSAARCFGLTFMPLRQEKFDLVLSRSIVRSKSGKALLDILNRAPLRRELEQLAGYETSETGKKII